MNTCETSNRLQPLIMPSITWAWRAFVLPDNDKLQHGGCTLHQLSVLFSSKSGLTREGFHAVTHKVVIVLLSSDMTVEVRFGDSIASILWIERNELLVCYMSPPSVL